MAKVKVDIEDLHSSDERLLGIVDEGSFGSADEKPNMASRTYLDGDDDSAYNFRDLSNEGVTYRFVQVGDEPISQPGEQDPGQFYVIGNHQDVYEASVQKAIIQRESGISKTIKKRDDKRRATHNEVERRRRDKINSWIARLAALVPGTAGQLPDAQSKGGILAKACDYIAELTSERDKCQKCVRENEKLSMEVLKLKKDLADAWKENALLKYQLSEQSITPCSGQGKS